MIQPEDQDQPKKQELNRYAVYSGMGFQMIVIIGIFMYIGYKIDESRHSEKLLFTAIMGMLGVCASLYLTIRSLKKIKP
jgi:hypothetical protein